MTIKRKGKRRRLYEQAVSSLLSSKDCKAAAANCGISYSTLLRWQHEPAFQKLYNDAKQEILESVKNQIRQLGLNAVRKMGDVISDVTVDTNEQLNASKYVIDRILQFEITDGLTLRLDQLESSVIDGEEA